MSRIHDALRRGAWPAGAPKQGRPAHTDAVLAALGYPSGKSRARRATRLLAALGLSVLAIAAWLWSARSEERGARSEGRGAKSEAGSTTIDAAVAKVPAPIVATTPVAVPSADQSAASGAPVSRRAPQPDPAPVRVPPRPQPDAAPLESNAPSSPSALAPPSSPLAPREDDFQRGLYFQRAGDFEQALLHYKAALQRDEMNIEAHNNLGHLYLGRGLLDEAAREFERVIAIEPQYVTARINLSATLYGLGRFDAAAAQARQALRYDARNESALINLGLAQKASGQGGDAQLSLRRALEIDPRSAAAHYNLARHYEEAGEAARALDHYRLFLQHAGPEHAAYAEPVRTRVAALAARMK